MRLPTFSPSRPRSVGLGAWRPAGVWLRLIPGLGGVAILGVTALGLPFPVQQMAQFEALNRELGKLCSNPPRQAQTVCRLHARLVSSL
jgi:hypothetical protein